MALTLDYAQQRRGPLGPLVERVAAAFGYAVFSVFLAELLIQSMFGQLQFFGEAVLVAIAAAGACYVCFSFGVNRRARQLGPVFRLRTWSWAVLAGLAHALLINVAMIVVGRIAVSNIWLLSSSYITVTLPIFLCIAAALWAFAFVRPAASSG
jgi:hypothetical protein